MRSGGVVHCEQSSLINKLLGTNKLGTNALSVKLQLLTLQDKTSSLPPSFPSSLLSFLHVRSLISFLGHYSMAKERS